MTFPTSEATWSIVRVAINGSAQEASCRLQCRFHFLGYRVRCIEPLLCARHSIPWSTHVPRPWGLMTVHRTGQLEPLNRWPTRNVRHGESLPCNLVQLEISSQSCARCCSQHLGYTSKKKKRCLVFGWLTFQQGWAGRVGETTNCKHDELVNYEVY